MTKIDIFSGFLGAGKTTLIKKLIQEAFAGERLVLIENEFGEIGIDGGFMKDAGIEVTEMNSGCICCSLVGDFGEALEKVLETYHPDRILIEPSGVGKLSDVIRAVQNLKVDGVEMNSFTTVADANKCKMYMKNFGEFFNNQIEHAGCIVLSRTDGMGEEKLAAIVALLREHNTDATVITTPWGALSGTVILEAMERRNTLAAELERLAAEAAHHDDDDDDECECEHHHHHHDGDDDDDEDGHEHHHHHHDDDDDDDEDGHKHHHHHHDDDDDDDEDEHEHHHHHHDDDDDDDEDEHEHHHHHHDDDDEDGHEHHHHHHYDENGECSCGHHHHHHHADEVFTSWGTETARKFTAEEIRAALTLLDNAEKYGVVLRAKGIVAAQDGSWIHFDHVPGEADVRTGSAAVLGRLCVIGSKLNEEALKQLFRV